MGAAFARTLPKRLQRPEIYWACVIGNNAPDLDFLIRFLPGSDSLSYLVHHRGYSHTFLLAPVLGIFSAVAAKKIARTNPWSFSIFAFAILGCFMHIGADYLNNYGVHPLTPFLNQWYYGDSISIVEPTLWFALIPFVAQEADHSWARIAWWLLGLSMVGVVWLFPTFTSGLPMLLSIFFVLNGVMALRLRTSLTRGTAAAGFLAVVLGAFLAGGAAARKITRGAWQSSTEGTEAYLDTSSNPLPGNPLCWSIWIGSKSSTEFIFRSAIVSLWPELISTLGCDSAPITVRTAAVRPVPFSPDRSIHWEVESRLSLDDWEKYRKKSPKFRRFLAFARFPFLKPLPTGGAVMGDLRFDRGGIGFAEFEIPPDEKNDSEIGPWINPLGRKTH
jgi:membrane-bound metal-dependent hydrolase YbcI (DUF457 family)